jgi:hypothetical protein
VEGLYKGFCLHNFDLPKGRGDWDEALGVFKEVESKPDRSRAILELSSPESFSNYGNEKWITKITNLGPATSIGIQMQLVDINPAPKCDPSIKGRCPHKVIISGLTFDASARSLVKDQSETFELFRVHPGGPVSNVDTEHARDITIEIGGRWCLLYRVFAKNSDAVDLAPIMQRNTDGSVKIEHNH